MRSSSAGHSTISPLSSIKRTLDEQRPSVAVFPFENLSGPEHEYFADGFTDAVITELAKLKSVRVISRTSVMQYRRAPKPVPDAARELNVTYVVTGSVIQQGGKVQFTCQLIQAEPESHVWADSYDLSIADIPQMHAEIARTLVSNIPGCGWAADQRHSVRAVNPQAYDAVLKGRHHWNRITPHDLHKSLEYFDAALAHDPLSAPAYAGLADAHLWLGVLNLIPHAESYLKARAAAEKALQIDPNNPDAWHTLGCVAGYAWEWEHAESCLRKSIALNPNSAAAHMSYGSFLAHMGRFQEAMQENRVAHTLDPLAANIQGEYGMILIEARRFGEAVKHLRRMIRSDPNYFLAYFHLGRAHIYEGRLPQAIEALEAAVKLARIPDCVAVLAYAHAKAGHRVKATDLLRKLESLARTDDVPAFLLAVAVLGFGDRDRAIGYLEMAYRQRDWLMRLIAVEPGFDDLRADPRFMRLVEALRLPSACSASPSLPSV